MGKDVKDMKDLKELSKKCKIQSEKFLKFSEKLKNKIEEKSRKFFLDVLIKIEK